MIYSYETYKEKYRLGYARSNDGINWKRMDNLFNLENSKNKWDSQMVEYGTIINFKKEPSYYITEITMVERVLE